LIYQDYEIKGLKMAERDKDGFYRKIKTCGSCGQEIAGQSCRSMTKANTDVQYKIKLHEKKKKHPFWPEEENHLPEEKEIIGEIKGAWVDQKIVCNDCLTLSEYKKVETSQRITNIEVQDQGNSYICDRCERPLIRGT